MASVTSSNSPAVQRISQGPLVISVRRAAIKALSVGIIVLMLIGAALYGAKPATVTYTLAAGMSVCGIGLVLLAYPGKGDVVISTILAAGWLWVWWHPPSVRADSLQAAAVLAGAASAWFAGTRMARGHSRRELVALSLMCGGGAFVGWTFLSFATQNGGAQLAPPSGRLSSVDLILAILATFAFSRVMHVVKSNGRGQLSILYRLVDIMSSALWAVLMTLMALAYLWATGPTSGLVLAATGLAVFLMLDIRHWPKREGRQRSGIWLVLAGVSATVAAGVLIGGELFIATGDEPQKGFDLELRLRQISQSIGLHLELWRQSPFFGHGLGSYDSVQAITAQARPDLLIEGRFHLHTMFLRGLVELGLIGMTLALTGLVYVLLVIRRSMNTTSKSQTPMKLSLAVMVVFCLAGLADPVWTTPAAIWLTVLLVAHGYGTAVHHSRPSGPPAESTP